MKKRNIDEIAEYSATYKKAKKKPTQGQLIVVLLAFTALVLAAAVVVLSLYYTGVFDEATRRKNAQEEDRGKTVYTGFVEYSFTSTLPSGSYANFTFESEGTEYKFTAYLIDLYAPNTVNNFISYAKEGYYNGTAVKDGRVTTQDDKTKGVFTCGGYVRAGEGFARKAPVTDRGAIKGEFVANGYDKNKLSNKAGMIGMVHSDGNYDDATTDFYVLPYDDTSLDGYYAAFAKITTDAGISAARKIAKAASDGKEITLKTVTITTK